MAIETEQFLLSEFGYKYLPPMRNAEQKGAKQSACHGLVSKSPYLGLDAVTVFCKSCQYSGAGMVQNRIISVEISCAGPNCNISELVHGVTLALL